MRGSRLSLFCSASSRSMDVFCVRCILFFCIHISTFGVHPFFGFLFRFYGIIWGGRIFHRVVLPKSLHGFHNGVEAKQPGPTSLCVL